MVVFKSNAIIEAMREAEKNYRRAERAKNQNDCFFYSGVLHGLKTALIEHDIFPPVSIYGEKASEERGK